MSQHKIHKLIQGSPEWRKHRAVHRNASDAPAMMGVSLYVSRSELLAACVLGIEHAPDAAEQKRFDDGHEYEATARPWAEEIIGEDLFPVVVSREVDGLALSASYDGVTIGEDTVFEHKTLNQDLDAALARGEIPHCYKPQMEQQLLVIGAERCLFMASNGTKEGMRFAWYKSDPALRARLVAGWKQFEEDVKVYVHVETPVKPAPAPIRDLPILALRVEGSLTIAGNLEAFGAELQAFVARIPSTLQTDQDFADAEAAVKALQKAQEALESEEARALAQTASVDDMRRTVAEYVTLARTNRLALNKLVEARKVAIRSEILEEGKRALAAHLDKLNKRLGRPFMPAVLEDFAGAMKAKKSIATLRDAVQTELARVKIVANEIADRIEVNVKAVPVEHVFLFADLSTICLKANDDFAMLVKARVAEHERKEAEKADALRETIRKEEEAKATAKLAVVPAPVATNVTAIKSAPGAGSVARAAPARRPTDAEIVAALAERFQATDAIVIAWLTEFDSETAARNRVPVNV